MNGPFRVRRLPPSPGAAREVGTRVDFDLHGLIGVRLLDASESDVRAVHRQLGPAAPALDRAPDVTVRFVERLPLQGATLVKSQGSAFTEEGFLILQAEGSRVHAQIPLWELGGGACEIVCESGVRTVPLLLEAVRLAALRRGILALPASAFEYEGVGMLVAGGSQGGKTSALLAFARHGALYVGDDLIFVRGNGGEMFGLDTPLVVPARQIEDLPAAAATLGPSERAQLALHERLEAVRRWATDRAPRGSLRDRLGESIAAPLQERLRVERLPRELFGDARLPAAEPRQVFLTLCHDAPDVRVKGVTAGEFASRVANLLRADDLPLLRHHLDYRVAALGQPQGFVDRAHELRRTLLERIFGSREAFVVRRPPRAPLEGLFRAMTRVRGEGPRYRTEPGPGGEGAAWRARSGREGVRSRKRP